MSERRARGCAHEAGHAAACLLLRVRVLKIMLPWVITAEDSTNGQVGVFRIESKNSLHEALISLGGYAGEELLWGWDPDLWDDQHSDWTNAAASAYAIGWTMGKMVGEVRGLLAAHAELVIRISEALSETTELDESVLQAIYAEYMDGRARTRWVQAPAARTKWV